MSFVSCQPYISLVLLAFFFFQLVLSTILPSVLHLGLSWCFQPIAAQLVAGPLGNPFQARNNTKDDDFAFSLAFTDDCGLFIVGAPGQNKAYLYELDNGSGGTLISNLIGSDVGNGALFGFSVATSSTHAVISAIRQDGPGAAYLYRFSSISTATTYEATKIATPAIQSYSNAEFGYTVVLHQDKVVLGTNSAASVLLLYQIQSDGVTVVLKSTLTTPLPGDCLDMSDQMIAIGAPNYHTVYWVPSSRLGSAEISVTHQLQLGNSFGESISVSGSHVAVGPPLFAEFTSSSSAPMVPL